MYRCEKEREKLLSRVQIFVTPWTVAYRASTSMGFFQARVLEWVWELDYKESWEMKNWCFRTVVWGRLLRVPWTVKTSNQSIPKKISPEYSLEGLMLKPQYFGHLMQRTDSLEKTLMLGKIEGGRRGDNRAWDGWMASPTWWMWVWASPGSWWQTESLTCSSLWGHKESGMTEWTEQWTIRKRN